MNIQTRHEQIARQLGEEAGRLHELKASIIDRLVREGGLVLVHIGRWRATHRLAAEDLGLDPDVAESLLKQVSLGWKLLLPREIIQELSRLESAARGNLARYSLDSALGPFVPSAAFKHFKAAHNELTARYLSVRDDILARLDEIRSAVGANFARAAADLYPTVVRHLKVDRETFVAEYVNRAMGLYPSAERIHASFYFDYEVSYIPLSSEVLAEEAQRAAVVRDEQLREELIRHVAQRKQAEVDDFLTSIVQQLRKTVYDAVTSALTSLRTRGTVPPRTVGRLRSLIEQVRILRLYSDAVPWRAMGTIIAMPRASCVEFDTGRQQWIARDAQTDAVVAAGMSREQVLSAERQYYLRALRGGALR